MEQLVDETLFSFCVTILVVFDPSRIPIRTSS
jgi:hypothetical protein